MTQRKYFISITLLIILLFQLLKLTASVSNRKTEDSLNIQRCMPSSSNNNNLKNINNLYLTYNNGILKRHAFNLSSTSKIKKWNVSKVSRKQYELINMLLRKTKIFVDMESNTNEYQARRENLTRKAVNTFRHLNSFQGFLPHPFMYSSTPSYFEFYYLHEVDDRIKRKDMENQFINGQSKVKGELLLKNEYDNVEILPKTPIFAIHVFDKFYKKPQVTTSRLTRSRKIYPTKYINNFPPKNRNIRLDTTTSIFPYKDTKTKATLKNSRNSLKNTVLRKNISKTSEHFNDNETCLYTKDLFDLSNYSNAEKSYNIMTKNVYHVKPSTLYDKIKFFETYDKHTRIPQLKYAKLLHIVNGTEISEITQQKIRLENIDEDFAQNRHTKKHIIERRNKFNEKCAEKRLDIILKATTMLFNYKIHNKINTTESSQNRVKHESKVPEMGFNNVNKSASWLEYPFAAVYIYEPLRVHCDAAAISPHWLIAAGSCLFRHYKNPGGEGQSAFVAYCGENWWSPERVAYVKYSLVHPRYHPREKTRRTLYNIGVIQVVSSMATACAGWSPISLMSHHFATSEDISKATAIGWGLDRFDTKYSSMELPKWPLMAYEAPVHSDSCPGSIEYSKTNPYDDDTGVEDVYCLLLPPYTGEEGDPIHGSLLLIGEKLIALYLQEERRPWGEQSAQYTGTWRLIPWVLDVAREPDEADNFNGDI